MAPNRSVYLVIAANNIFAYTTQAAADAAALEYGSTDVREVEVQAPKKIQKRPTPVDESEDDVKVVEPVKKKAKATKANKEPMPVGMPGIFRGLKIMFTGTMDYGRKDMDNAAESCGAEIVKRVNQNPNYVVVGTKPGPSKMEEINEMGTKQLTQEEFFAFLQTGVAPDE